MSHTKRHDDILRVETVATLDTVALVAVELCEVFRAVAEGTPLGARQAERLAAQCVAMLNAVVEARNDLRLAASDTTRLH